MSNDRMPKMILNAKMEGDRKRGRPKKRWINDVEQDLRKLGIRNWRSRAGGSSAMEGCCEGSQGPPRTVELEIIIITILQDIFLGSNE
jgi:hypothetical protein